MCENCDPVGAAVEKIYRYGMCITAVGDDEEDVSTHFAYTTGLTALGLPELLLCGLPAETAGAMIHDVADRMRTGTIYVPGERVPNIIGGGHDVAIVEVIDTTYMRVTAQLYPNFRALQVVWPDDCGRFPWESGYSMCAEHQPLMGMGWL